MSNINQVLEALGQRALPAKFKNSQANALLFSAYLAKAGVDVTASNLELDSHVELLYRLLVARKMDIQWDVPPRKFEGNNHVDVRSSNAPKAEEDHTREKATDAGIIGQTKAEIERTINGYVSLRNGRISHGRTADRQAELRKIQPTNPNSAMGWGQALILVKEAIANFKD